jgi:hypothetical protein
LTRNGKDSLVKKTKWLGIVDEVKTFLLSTDEDILIEGLGF